MRKQLETQISELKNGRTLKQLKSEDKKAYYKVQGLSEKLSLIKAAEKGNFITREMLTEYRKLIIWIMTKKGNYRGMLNLKDAMTRMLSLAEAKELIFKTERGIKSLICETALNCAIASNDEQLYGDPKYMDWRLQALMNR